MPKTENIIVELSPATSAVLDKMFTESKTRDDAAFRYIKSVEGFAEALMDFAIDRKRKQWEYIDKSRLGRDLRVALDKLVNGKPLNAMETKLVEQFRAAAAPVVEEGEEGAEG